MAKIPIYTTDEAPGYSGTVQASVTATMASAYGPTPARAFEDACSLLRKAAEAHGYNCIVGAGFSHSVSPEAYIVMAVATLLRLDPPPDE